MEELKLNIQNVTGDRLSIYTGDALPLKEPNKVSLSGDIHTLNNFLSVRKTEGSGIQTVDVKTAIVEVNYSSRSILFQSNPESPYQTTIESDLKPTVELEQFFINKNKTFTREELVKLFRHSRMFFKDFEKHSQLLEAFQKLNTHVTAGSNESQDTRGNRERDFKKSVTTNVPTEFILKIPIFKGFDNVEFRVEICLDVTDGSARFWFESVELTELIQSQVAEIIKESLSEAIQMGLVIIYK